MKKIFVSIVLFFFAFTSFVLGQEYGEKRFYKSFDEWVISSNGSKLSMTSFITVQDILTLDNINVSTQPLEVLPQYRYEIYLRSTSKLNGKSSRICVYNTKIFINDVEVTRRQFPEGFTVLVDTRPTLIYWYETHEELIDIRIKWSDVCFFKE